MRSSIGGCVWKKSRVSSDGDSSARFLAPRRRMAPTNASTSRVSSRARTVGPPLVRAGHRVLQRRGQPGHRRHRQAGNGEPRRVGRYPAAPPARRPPAAPRRPPRTPPGPPARRPPAPSRCRGSRGGPFRGPARLRLPRACSRSRSVSERMIRLVRPMPVRAALARDVRSLVRHSNTPRAGTPASLASASSRSRSGPSASGTKRKKSGSSTTGAAHAVTTAAAARPAQAGIHQQSGRQREPGVHPRRPPRRRRRD